MSQKNHVYLKKRAKSQQKKKKQKQKQKEATCPPKKSKNEK